MNGMGSHHSQRVTNDEWLTPPFILEALGHFDLDPCAPINRPWPTAGQHYTIEDDGLRQHWQGRVWLNPPYGRETSKWMSRLAQHGSGTALIFARTETQLWFQSVWPKAAGLLFIAGRLNFHHVTGARAKANAGAPSVLVAYDSQNSHALEIAARAGTIEGQFVDLRSLREAAA